MQPEGVPSRGESFRDDLVVAAECMFTWYWLADLCAREGIGFVLGHALYMRAIHGGKAKNDRIDAHKIAALLRGRMIPQAYVYPPEMRATRDLLRRRNHLMRKRSELIAHIQNTVSQYNLPPLDHRIDKRCDRHGLLSHFPDPQVQNSIALDLALIEQYDELLPKLERHIRACAKQHDRKSFVLLRSIHGADLILPLVILYEIQDISGFARAQEFLSYCRLVKPTRESAGKIQGHAGAKIGNAHLKWAFGELATTPLTRQSPRPAAAPATQDQARQGQGPLGAGCQARPCRLLHAQARTDLRPSEVLPGLTSEPAAASSTPNWSYQRKSQHRAACTDTRTTVPEARHRSMDRFRATQCID